MATTHEKMDELAELFGIALCSDEKYWDIVRLVATYELDMPLSDLFSQMERDEVLEGRYYAIATEVMSSILARMIVKNRWFG